MPCCRRANAPLLFLLLLAISGGCRLATEFACEVDSECESGGDGPRCEPGGSCSFSDDTCDTGRRYGKFAERRLAGECVPDDSATPGTDGASTGASSPAPTDGEGPAGCDGRCVHAVPGGWNGPITLHLGGTETCSGSALWTAGTSVSPEGTCDCQCSGTETVACDFDFRTGPTCDSGGITTPGLAAGCLQFNNTWVAFLSGSESEPTSCVLPPPLPSQIVDVRAACVAPLLDGVCPAGLQCASSREGEDLCYWREGTHSCLFGATRTLLYREARGGYDCGCQCGTEGACETIEVFSNPDCTGSATLLDISENCDDPAIGPSGPFGYRNPTSNGECVDLGSRNSPKPLEEGQAPQGSDPVTVCCDG